MDYISTGTFYANETILVDVTLATPAQAEYTSMVAAVVQLRTNPNSNAVMYEFSAGAEWGETISFDISSAFRAELAKKKPLDADGPNYGGEPQNNRVVLYISTGARYLFKGEATEIITNSGAYAVAWRGGRSEAELLTNALPAPREYTETDYNNGLIEAQHIGFARPVTTKPKEWETVHTNDTLRIGYYSEGVVAANQEYTSARLGGRMIYAETNPLRRSFMFENHLGFIESASCMTRDSKSYKISSDTRHLSYAPSYDIKASLYSRKNEGRAVWKMSSGYVTREWAEWFATEFLMSPHHWMRINDRWLPVNITPDSDSTTIYDESKGEMTAINFTVTSGIKGRL